MFIARGWDLSMMKEYREIQMCMKYFEKISPDQQCWLLRDSFKPMAHNSDYKLKTHKICFESANYPRNHWTIFQTTKTSLLGNRIILSIRKMYIFAVQYYKLWRNLLMEISYQISKVGDVEIIVEKKRIHEHLNSRLKTQEIAIAVMCLHQWSIFDSST